MLNSIRSFLLSLVTNKFLGIGLALLVLFLVSGYFLIDKIIMPSFVGHNEFVTVPDVKDLPVEEATLQLEDKNLFVEIESGRYNPQLPRDVVVDQNPKANFPVKPGRRVYLTLNSGATPESTVPSLSGISLKEALNRLNAAGLRAEPQDIQPDSIPHPYENMVTRQSPEPGTVVAEGARVRLWYSTGLGSEYVTVPDLTNLDAREAQRLLLSRKLRSVVLGGDGSPEVDLMPVYKQSHPVGTRIKEGSEIRLFVRMDNDEGEGQN